MKLRPTVTVGALALWSVLVTATPALAAGGSGDDGEVPGEPMSMARILLIYVGIPVAIIVVVWLLASLPYMIKSPRYRPGLSWWAAPVWFGGPESESSQESADGAAAAAAAHEGSGGTSARW